MEKFESINPYSGETIHRFEPVGLKESYEMIERSDTAFRKWKRTNLSERIGLLETVAKLLMERKKILATAMTQEMGKPIEQAEAEIVKCAWVCRYYASNAVEFLAHEPVKTDASESWVIYEPMGVLLAIMPWNFPFWQFFRFAAPSITAGNVALLKHSPNTQMSAAFIEALFKDAGYPESVVTNLIVKVDDIPAIIEHPLIKAVTLTGSTRAGSAVAQEAGANIKKTVLELGGNNPFIVLPDADIDRAVETGFLGRMMNTGQSCIAAKRFIIHEDVYDEYLDKFLKRMEGARVADPMEESTFFGPLARTDLAELLESQVQRSIEAGAETVCGLERKDAHFQPGVIVNVKPGMAVFDEETFGPVAAFTKAASIEEAIALANASEYGLGATVCTGNVDKHLYLASEIEGGSLFFNEFVKSDPRLPFGGTGKSGYGRELGKEGIREFVNIKTVYVK